MASANRQATPAATPPGTTPAGTALIPKRRLRLLPLAIALGTVSFATHAVAVVDRTFGTSLAGAPPALAAAPTGTLVNAPSAAPSQAVPVAASAPAPAPNAASGAAPVAATAANAQPVNRGLAPEDITDSSDVSMAELDILKSLAQRRGELDLRARQLDERATLVRASEGRVDAKLAEMKQLKADLEKLIGQKAKTDQEKLASLVKIYETMKPREAADIFDRLEIQVQISVIEQMKEVKAAPIIAAMDPDQARRLTQELARRRGVDLSAVVERAKQVVGDAPAPAPATVVPAATGAAPATRTATPNGAPAAASAAPARGAPAARPAANQPQAMSPPR